MQEKRRKANVEQDVATVDTTSTKETSMLSSLRAICIRFIAVNIELVDSLVGFPEVVGKALFSEVEKCGNLCLNKPQCGVTMQLFLSAYHAAVLAHLTLRSAHLLINQHFDIWQRFMHLRILDLGGCHLGDGHDMLSFVGQLECLTCLSFQDNCLSDAGVRKFTCPSRVLARGPSNLRILDLSANPLLTNDAVRYLLHFEMLEILDLSGTKVSKRGIQKLEEKSLLMVDERAVGDVEKTFCGVCVGWAANTITKWTDKLQCGPSEDSNNKSTVAKFWKPVGWKLGLGKQVFYSSGERLYSEGIRRQVLLIGNLYGRSKQRIALAQTLTICKPSNRYPVICLRKSKHKFDVQQRQSRHTRSLSGEQHGSGALHRKHELSKEDMAMMASYTV